MNFEREADYVGAHYAARAGYDLAGAEKIWRAFSLENPDDIRVGHAPGNARAFRTDAKSCRGNYKQRRNTPLVPELNALRAEVNPTDDFQ